MAAESTPLSLKQETTDESGRAVESVSERRPRKPENSVKFGVLAIEAEPKRRSPVPEAQPIKNVNPEQANTMTRAELMETGGKVMVDGTSLRQMYESRLLGERGVRRLVAEYLRGGNLHEALKSEVLERQRDFEKDPALRGKSKKSDTKPVDGPSKMALDNLLQKADVSLATGDEQAAFLKAQSKYEAKSVTQRKKRQRMMDISLAAVIAILAVLVAALFLLRR